MPTFTPDVLILGAGVLGSSAAWHLAQRKVGSILVIDLDLSGTFSSSELNAGGCRATWWNPINAALAWESIRFYETIAEEIQFFQKGYLFLYSPSKWRIAREKKSLYESLGTPVDYLPPDRLKELLPEFENLKGIAGATYSPKDGLIDPHLVREFYRAGAKERGVRFLDHVYVQQMRLNSKKVEEVMALHHEGGAPPTEETFHRILTHHQWEADRNWKKETFTPKIVINCTGAWLPVTSNLYGVSSPVKPLRRQISLFSSHEEDLSDHGMIVDTSGLYMHPEGSHTHLMLAGYSNRDEKPGYNFAYDGEPFFDRKIWLRLYRRGGRRHFEAIKHVRGWSGLYEVSPDMTAILWKVEGFDNLYELGAATGRGVMQSYALGRALAELIVSGRFETVDASPLSGNRFKTGKFLWEKLDI
jgi:FAD-dependent oxidoreductase domain-containing protein 1